LVRAEETVSSPDSKSVTDSAEILESRAKDLMEPTSQSVVVLTNTSVSELTNQKLHTLWLKQVAEAQKAGKSYPKRISIVVIVESDEADPHKEGSRDAAPVAAKVIDWMEGKERASE
jgi:hypothetical protein